MNAASLDPSDLVPDADLATEAAALRARLADLPILNTALDRNAADLDAAVAAQDAAKAVLASAHVARARGNGPTDAQVKKLAAAVAEAAAQIEALSTAEGALQAELLPAEDEVKDWAFSPGRANIADRYAAVVSAAFGARCRKDYELPLWSVVVEATALAAVTGSRGLSDWLHRLRVDLPGPGEFINGQRLTLPDGTWIIARDAAAARIEELRAAGAGDIRTLLVEAGNYRPRAERMAKKAPYVIKGRTYPPEPQIQATTAGDEPQASVIRPVWASR